MQLEPTPADEAAIEQFLREQLGKDADLGTLRNAMYASICRTWIKRERERAAKVAEDESPSSQRDEYSAGYETAQAEIAAAIRKGPQP